jgi:uncharacterized protein YkwD
MLLPDADFDMMTNEGPSAWSEAILFLESQSPLEPMEWDAELYAAAASHTADLGPKGTTSHDSTDGTTFDVRIGNFFTESTTIAENISYGTQKWGYDAEAVILALVIDDGVPNRGHRTNIFSPDLL